MRRIAFAVLSLFHAGASVALAQTPQEALQEQLVDSVNRTEQEITRAVSRFNADDRAGGCTDLRAAAGDTATSIGLAERLSAVIGGDTSLSEETRGRMLGELADMRTRFIAQKQSMDGQIASRCNG